jgi:hypothetical protein
MKDVKTVTAYRIITDVPQAVVVGFKPNDFYGLEYDEFECVDTVKAGEGSPDDSSFITESGNMIITAESVSMVDPETNSTEDLLWAQPDLEIVRHPEQWTALARMLNDEDEEEDEVAEDSDNWIAEKYHYWLQIDNDRVEIIDYFDKVVLVVEKVSDIARFCTKIRPGCHLMSGIGFHPEAGGRGHAELFTNNEATIALVKALN